MGPGPKAGNDIQLRVAASIRTDPSMGPGPKAGNDPAISPGMAAGKRAFNGARPEGRE